MNITQANEILSDSNIAQAALVLSALDRLQADEFNLLEPALRRLGKFSESDMMKAADAAIQGHGFMAIPGNGQGVKMNLSVLLNSLQLIGRIQQMELAMAECKRFEVLHPS